MTKTNHVTQSDSPELRAAWVSHDSIVSTSGRRSLLRKVRDAHLNSVFVAAPPLGSNYGEGSAPNFVSFVNDAKAEGLITLGWISNHKRTYPEPADLRLPSERDAQAAWARDLLREYPCLDGVAIDYIRYPTWEESDGAKNAGVTETVRRIRQVTDAASRILVSTTFPAATITFRGTAPSNWEGDVPEWYRQWYAANPGNYFAREAKNGGTGVVNQGNVGGTETSFLLGPSFMSYQQDPISWINGGYIDHVVPMQYTADVEVMRNEVDVWTDLMGWIGADIAKINMGVGWMDEPTSFPDSAFDPAAMASHIKYARSKGMGGYTIFRLGIPGEDDAPLIDALTTPNADNGYDPPFASDVPSTLGTTDADEQCPGEVDGLDVTDDWGMFETSGGPRRFASSSSSSSIWSTTLLAAVLLRGLNWAFRS